jgi:hypothetical protein
MVDEGSAHDGAPRAIVREGGPGCGVWCLLSITLSAAVEVCCEVMMFASMYYVLRARADSEIVVGVLFVFDPCALVGVCLRVLLCLSLPRGGCWAMAV